MTKPEDHWSCIAHLSAEENAELEQLWKFKSTQCSISCHPYRSIKNKFDAVIKMIKVNPGSSFEKKNPGHGHTTTWYKSSRLLKPLLFPSVCTSFRKIAFASLFYMIFCFISYMYIKLQGKKRHFLGTFFFLHASRKILSL